MKLYKYFVIGCALLSLSSCSDFLDADNKSNANQNGFDVVSKDPNVLRATAYNNLKSLATETNLTEIGTDFYSCKPGQTENDYGTYLILPTDKNVLNFYKNCYYAINQANAILRFAPDDKKFCQEAIFLRSLYYYYLTQQFGAVPYVDYYIADSNREYPRTPLNELYPQLIKDLEDVYNDCALVQKSQTGEATKQAVAALLARICLAAGWDLGTSFVDEAKGTYDVNDRTYFAMAAKYAEAAIGGQALTLKFGEKWNPFNKVNDEVIFAAKYERNGFPGDVTTSGHSLQNRYINLYGNCKVTGMKGTSSGGDLLLTRKAVRLFEPGDERFEGTFMTTYYNAEKGDGGAMWGTQGYMAFYNVSDADKAKLQIAYKWFHHSVTKEEAQAWAVEHKKQLATDKNKYTIADVTLAVIDEPNCTVFTFNNDGSVKDVKETAFSQFYSKESTVYGVRKWDDPESDNVTGSNSYQDIPFFHLSDMYLVAAEAYYMNAEEGKALAKINDVRKRAGVKALSSFAEYENLYQYNISVNFNIVPLDVILDERAREMYAERTRWMDLRRTKQLVRYNVEFNASITSIEDMKGPDGKVKWLRPIPENELLSNTSLSEADQNPGYIVPSADASAAE